MPVTRSPISIPREGLSSAFRRHPHLVALAAFTLVVACRRDRALAPAPAPGPARHLVSVNRPARLTSIETEVRDGRGKPLRVACATCHALRSPGPLPTKTADLKEFHRGLTFAHGALACAACHVAGHAEEVHLADGTAIAMTEALRLCSQCHGPQARDFGHGAHGGMTGYWDLSAGPRVRNNCVDCHDPHAPKFRGGIPAPRPRDRGGITHDDSPGTIAELAGADRRTPTESNPPNQKGHTP